MIHMKRSSDCSGTTPAALRACLRTRTIMAPHADPVRPDRGGQHGAGNIHGGLFAEATATPTASLRRALYGHAPAATGALCSGDAQPGSPSRRSSPSRARSPDATCRGPARRWRRRLRSTRNARRFRRRASTWWRSRSASQFDAHPLAARPHGDVRTGHGAAPDDGTHAGAHRASRHHRGERPAGGRQRAASACAPTCASSSRWSR